MGANVLTEKTKMASPGSFLNCTGYFFSPFQLKNCPQVKVADFNALPATIAAF
jgi:hypothetical protein